jgi:hypothetical protein
LSWICHFPGSHVFLFSGFAPKHSLDLTSPPKAHVLKTWSLAWCYWKVVEICKRWILEGGFRLLEAHPWKGLWDTSLLLFHACSCHEVNKLPLPPDPATMCCLTTGPKGIGPTDHGLKPPKPWTKISFPLYNLIISDTLLQ